MSETANVTIRIGDEVLTQEEFFARHGGQATVPPTLVAKPTRFSSHLDPFAHEPPTPTMPRTLTVRACDIAAMEADNRHLRAQRDELQAANTRMTEEKRAVDWSAHVEQLFEVFDQAAPSTPGFPDETTIALRRKMLREEFNETIEALDARDFVEVVDGCIDTVVVAIGMLVAFGVDPRPFWNEVHANNLTKAGGPVSSDGKRLKPPGWTPPDIAGLLWHQGYRDPNVSIPSNSAPTNETGGEVVAMVNR